jgi:uncharacterized membrane protein YhaH (DUF805 family)
MSRNSLWKLLAPDQPLSGRAYLLLGLVLFFIKYAIDSTISLLMMHRPWSPWNYLSPGAAFGIPDSQANLPIVWTMLAVSIPFIITGIMLTTRRLRTAGLPTWLAVTFFIPLINFLFFIVISLQHARIAQPISTLQVSPPRSFEIPSAPAPLLNYGRDQIGPGSALIGRFLPTNPWLSAIAAILIPVPIALGMVYLGVNVFKGYGWGLFVGLPFVMAMLSILIRSYHQPVSLGRCIGLVTLAMVIYAVALLAVAFEGAGCIIMALPLIIPIAMVGAIVGHMIQRARHVNASGIAMALLLFLPLFLGAESATLPPAPLYSVTTIVEVDAPPSVVWNHVIHFTELPPPTELIFRSGVAYPMRAEISGFGVGACRHCIFSTGAFVEPITDWDQGKLLRFNVTDNPPPMKEWTPYANVHPPHLDNFLVSHAGQFRLIALEGGRTRLEGTTWYQHHMWPAGYWRLWSDSILHTIHRRVLNHVKHLSEGDNDHRIASSNG